MATESALELRVRRLENDTSAIYEILGEIKETQQEHTVSLDAMDQRFDGVDQRFDGVDHRLDGIDETLAEVLRRLPEPS